MINYSIYLRTNPMDKEEAPKAYGVAQYNSVMTIDKFAAHIASHGCVYSRADIAAVLTLAVDCLYEYWCPLKLFVAKEMSFNR